MKESPAVARLFPDAPRKAVPRKRSGAYVEEDQRREERGGGIRSRAELHSRALLRPPLRILLFVGRLTAGGAERQVLQIARGLAGRGHEVAVWTLYPGGELAGALADMPAVASGCLFARRPRSLPGRGFALVTAARHLRRALSGRRTDVVYSFLYPASVLAGLAVGRPARCAWVLGIRSAAMELNWKRTPFFALCAHLSRRADLLVANSGAGLEHHLRHGFSTADRRVIHNGIDLDLFRPDPELRRAGRARCGLPADAPVIGRVGRLSPEKDYPGFLRGARLLLERHPGARFLCVGGGPVESTRELEELGRRLGLGDRVVWTGARTDMPELYNAMNVCVSSSTGDAFPNVVAEAMACGVPGVVTDVGESALLVGDVGRVVPPSDPRALADAVAEVLDRPPTAEACRRYISRFGVGSMLDATEAALSDAVARRRR